jgi:hypothetical protein
LEENISLFKDLKPQIRKIPIIGSTILGLYRSLQKIQFRGSKDYWNRRYVTGGNSGQGSYGILAEFKAEILNRFVIERDIQTVIEYGCGDGNQLKLADYPSYVGFDVSPEAIKLCQDLFDDDKSKGFNLMGEYRDELAELTLSIDVIYHLVEDEIFERYMARLFSSSTQYVIIYSSNYEGNSAFESPHIRHRIFTDWVKENLPGWKLVGIIPNKYPLNTHSKEGSPSNFYIYTSEHSIGYTDLQKVA